MSKVVGNVRVGEKRIARSGKSYPSGRDTFRITSKWNAYLMPVHTVYGGKINSWSPDRDENAPKNQFELVTDTNQLQICMVPSRCVSESWQLWTAAGKARDCTGRVCTIGKGENAQECPCKCDPIKRECKPHTTLTFMLSKVIETSAAAFLWTYSSNSGIFANELHAFLQELDSMGLSNHAVCCLLNMEWAEKNVPGQAKEKFVRTSITIDPNPPDMVRALRGLTIAGQLE